MWKKKNGSKKATFSEYVTMSNAEVDIMLLREGKKVLFSTNSYLSSGNLSC